MILVGYWPPRSDFLALDLPKIITINASTSLGGIQGPGACGCTGTGAMIPGPASRHGMEERNVLNAQLEICEFRIRIARCLTLIGI